MAEDKTKIDTLWIKCLSCNEIIYRKEVEKHLFICPRCGYHFRISANEWIKLLADPETFVELDENIEPVDELEFKDTIPYSKRIEETRNVTKLKEAIITGRCRLGSFLILLGIFDFEFMGGSMGSVVGEKLSRLFEKGANELIPVITITSSGGARMQEGIIALMQMAKTVSALNQLKDKGVPYISILSDPTTGGVAASFAFLGDIIIAEPKALVGFAGPRVIENTIRQKLPEGFQRAEFALQHGMVDMVVDRKNLKRILHQLLLHITS